MDYVVVMAGGTGKRLWPLSRKKRPKQVLKIIDGQTLLWKCFQRLKPVFDVKNIIVLTNAEYVDIVRENLPELPAENVIAEPAVRDTASAIGLAATVLAKRDSEATMVVVTADQLMEPDEIFQTAVKDALKFVNDNSESLLTFGVKPSFADTQLGYIKCADARKYAGCENEIYSVEAFREKPNEETAKEYLNSGQYFWNAGMFVWRAKTILNHLAKFLPESVEPLAKISADWNGPNRQKTLGEWFVKLPKISIDYAVMEKAEKVFAIKLDCKWFDMGSFEAMTDIVDCDENNNVAAAEKKQLLDCKNSIFVTEDDSHLIAAIGLDDMIVVHSPDATLICRRNQSHRLKELLDQIKEQGKESFL